jgi:hypothetical protein
MATQSLCREPANAPRRASLLAALVSALLVGLACSTQNPFDASPTCTLIGCEDGYRVDLKPDSGWPAGEYRFLIDSDDAHVECRASVPLPACGVAAVSCEPRGVVTIAESGCALPANAQGFPRISFERGRRPRRVRLSIVRSVGGTERVIASTELLPRFETVQPNGPKCPPVCTQARDSLTVGF